MTIQNRRAVAGGELRRIERQLADHHSLYDEPIAEIKVHAVRREFLSAALRRCADDEMLRLDAEFTFALVDHQLQASFRRLRGIQQQCARLLFCNCLLVQLSQIRRQSLNNCCLFLNRASELRAINVAALFASLLAVLASDCAGRPQ